MNELRCSCCCQRCERIAKIYIVRIINSDDLHPQDATATVTVVAAVDLASAADLTASATGAAIVAASASAADAVSPPIAATQHKERR